MSVQYWKGFHILLLGEQLVTMGCDSRFRASSCTLYYSINWSNTEYLLCVSEQLNIKDMIIVKMWNESQELHFKQLHAINVLSYLIKEDNMMAIFHKRLQMYERILFGVVWCFEVIISESNLKYRIRCQVFDWIKTEMLIQKF
jgi:hypothetical protein